MEMFLTSFVLQFDWMLCDSITSSGWTLCASVVDIDFSFFGCQVLLASNIRKVRKVQVLSTPKCLWKVRELWCFRNGCCIIMSCAFHMVILLSQLTWEDDCACDSAF
jgi:hypothetical protein